MDDQFSALSCHPSVNWRETAWQFHRAFSRVTGRHAGGIEEASFLALALCGEVGELANEIKKVWRGDAPLETRRRALATELADTMIYLVLLARALDIDIDRVAAAKQHDNLGRWPKITQAMTTVRG